MVGLPDQKAGRKQCSPNFLTKNSRQLQEVLPGLFLQKPILAEEPSAGCQGRRPSTAADRKVLLPESLSKSLLVILEIHHADDMKLSYHLDYDKSWWAQILTPTQKDTLLRRNRQRLLCAIGFDLRQVGPWVDTSEGKGMRDVRKAGMGNGNLIRVLKTPEKSRATVPSGSAGLRVRELRSL